MLKESKSHSAATAVLFVILSMLSLTSGASLAKQLFQVAGATGTTVVRVGLGALILCAFWRPWRFPLSREAWRWVALYGISLGTMNLMFYLAISYLPIGLAIAIEFMGPLGLALFHSKRPLDFLWAFLAGLGVFLILPLAGYPASSDWRGIFFAAGAACMWAAYIILGRRAGASAHPGSAAAVGTVVAFFAIAPFTAAQALPLFSTWNLVLTALAVGLLSSAVPYSLEMVALKAIPEKHFSLLMSLEPAIGALVGFVLLGEHLSLRQCVAIGCVVTASVGSTLAHREPAIEPLP